ncbi:RHS repeat-associated core domain-containing protein, partial [Kosakonia sp. YIM B13587]
RYYDPCGGRYTQMDPIGLLGGLNTYTYVVDPLTWVDPWGLASTCLDRDWGTYFARRSGTTPPTSMVNPHAHHIVFKGDFSRSPPMQEALKRSRNILKKYEINPVEDVSALMWAENRGHTVANAKLVANKLEAAHEVISSRGLNAVEATNEMKAALQRIGMEVFGS